MSPRKNLRMTVGVDAERLNRAIADAAAAWEKFGRAVQDVVDAVFPVRRPLTSAGRIAFNVACFVGFLPHAVMDWLETCPGAFKDEFGDGWE